MMGPMTLDEDQEELLRGQFAQGVLALNADPLPVYAEAIYQMTLNAALMLISHHERLPINEKRGHRTKSPQKLLEALTAVASVQAYLDASTLAEAIEVSNARRHGRATTQTLTAGHVQALAALDAYPHLRVTSTAQVDRAFLQGQLEVQAEERRAASYLELLDEEEQQRRVVAAADVGPADPKEQMMQLEPQDCPICWHTTILPTGPDSFGYGIVSGTCFVCGYHLTEHEADLRNLQMEFHHRWDKD